jgi:lysozyme
VNYLDIASEQLRRDEGYREKPYTDTVGKLTIGIGRNLDDVGLSQEECEFLYANDLERAVDTARRFVPKFDLLSETRKAVVVNMAFTLGGRLSEFVKFLAAVDSGRYPAAADEMLDSKWARQQAPNRARRLAGQMREGAHP